ncbi:MAG: phosphohistidine phosphatase SixA [Methylotenera sp.]|nr:phosphohistidine phosphatase SixA [Methylotenera sp.]
MANLILWRHAEAEEFSANGLDADRLLTKNGRKDATKMAGWLNEYLPENTEILCSPARRCQETATALNDSANNKGKHEIKIANFLSAESSVELIAKKLINEDNNQTILVVGHQPNLGLLIAKLLGMQESAVVKKGAVWWLRQRLVNGVLQTYLFTVQHPDY